MNKFNGSLLGLLFFLCLQNGIFSSDENEISDVHIVGPTWDLKPSSLEHEIQITKLRFEWGALDKYLICNFSPTTNTTIRWFFHSIFSQEEELDICETKFVVLQAKKGANKTVLSFTKVTTKFIGNFTCLIENEFGRDAHKFHVDVFIPWGKFLGVSFLVGSICLFFLILIIILFVKRIL